MSDTSTTVSSDISQPQEMALDAIVWVGGIKVVLESAAYDPVTSELTVASTWQNLSLTEANRAGLEWGVTVDSNDYRAQTTGRPYPVDATVRDPFTISGLPSDFSLSAATLYFGRPSEHRSTVDLSTGAATTTAPQPIAVSGTVAAGYDATYTVTRGEVVPWACFGVSEHLGYEPSKKSEVSVVLWGDYKTVSAPVGGFMFDTPGGGYTRLLLPDGTVLDATAQSGVVWNANQRALDVPTCFSGIVSPGSGAYTLQMFDGEAPEGSLPFTV